MTLTPDELSLLQRVGNSAKSAFREVQRAQILLRYHAGAGVATIARDLGTTRVSVT